MKLNLGCVGLRQIFSAIFSRRLRLGREGLLREGKTEVCSAVGMKEKILLWREGEVLSAIRLAEVAEMPDQNGNVGGLGEIAHYP